MKSDDEIRVTLVTILLGTEEKNRRRIRLNPRDTKKDNDEPWSRVTGFQLRDLNVVIP